MGNWSSSEGDRKRRTANLPISEAEWKQHEGDRYVIFPHYLAEDETAPHKEEEEEGEHQHEESRAQLRRHNLRWSRLKSILERPIRDVDEFERAMSDIAVREVGCYFFHEFFSKPTEEAKHFFEVTLPTIQRLALRLPELFPPDQRVPLLLQQHNASVTLTQEQCACLLACSFMGVLWIRPVFYATQHFHDFDLQLLFVSTFGPGVGKLQCILHYFDRLSESIPTGKVIFRRQALGKKDAPNWAKSKKPIRPIKVDSKGKIENADTPFHADFANKFIGGGVLSRGCVQEEILFVIKPECLVSILLCPVMEENEVIFIQGAERFSDYQGYAQSLAYGGDFVDTKRNEEGDIDNVIVAVDAIVAWGDLQWQTPSMIRDLNKMYCACWDPSNLIPDHPLATGNWGCGAFGGDKSLKAVQQMMSASQAERDLVYFTFGEKYSGRTLESWLLDLNHLIEKHSITVGDLYRVITRGGGANVFEAINRYFKDGRPSTPDVDTGDEESDQLEEETEGEEEPKSP